MEQVANLSLPMAGNEARVPVQTKQTIMGIFIVNGVGRGCLATAAIPRCGT
jgi:hypothetical protein